MVHAKINVIFRQIGLPSYKIIKIYFAARYSILLFLQFASKLYCLANDGGRVIWRDNDWIVSIIIRL